MGHWLLRNGGLLRKPRRPSNWMTRGIEFLRQFIQVDLDLSRVALRFADPLVERILCAPSLQFLRLLDLLEEAVSGEPRSD